MSEALRAYALERTKIPVPAVLLRAVYLRLSTMLMELGLSSGKGQRHWHVQHAILSQAQKGMAQEVRRMLNVVDHLMVTEPSWNNGD